MLAACGGGSGGPSIDEVADRLHALERASVSLRVESGDVGFTIEGAFSVDGSSALPVARLTHRPLGDDGRATTVVLTGDDGFVEVDGEAYRLPSAQLDALRVPEDGAATALSRLRLEDWLLDDDGGGDRSGPGDPDVVLPDVVALATGLGAADVLVDDVEGELVVEVETEDDGDLTSLTATADGFSFSLELADHGEPVEVDPPASARPFDELGR